MSLFRRSPSPDEVRARQDAAIDAFWAWWGAEGAARAAQLFDGEGQPDELSALAEDVGARVQAIAPLAFETGPGRGARHMLVVTPAGDPDLRDVAERWLAAAPAAGDAFEFATWRQPVADAAALVLEYGATPVALGEAAAVIVEEGGQVHVTVSHPRFGQMPEDDRAQVTFLFLDALLGEQAVEEHVGEIAWTSDRAPGAVALTDLAAVVERLRG